MQEGMLFHSLYNETENAYFEQATFTINGSLDLDVFNQSFNEILRRHDVLRTVFVREGVDKPVQVVLKERRSEIDFQDVSYMDTEEQEARIEQLKNQDKEKGFDLLKDLLMRVMVIKTKETTYRVIWSFHHIIMDGWCLGIIMKDFFEIYGGLKNKGQVNLNPVYSYGNYIQWLMKRDKKESQEYWKKYLEDFENQTTIPTSKNNQEKKYKRQEINYKLDDKLT